MSEEKPVEPQPTRHFLVRVLVEDLDGNRNSEIMDIVPGTDRNNVKNYMTGWLALREFKVKEWRAVTDIDNLRTLVGNISR